MAEHTQFLDNVGRERDDLDVAHGLGDAEQLDVDLVELPPAPLLRAVVAEHRPVAEQLDRQLLG